MGRASFVVLWLAAAAGSVQAQSALLKIQSVASSSGVRDHRTASGEQAQRSFNRTETLKVTVTNMQTNPCDYQVEWQFLAKDVTTKSVYAYNTGTKSVPLKGGSFAAFDVQSAPLPETQIMQYDYDDWGNLVPVGQRTEVGAKPAGYVFVVKASGKVITVEASDRDLKEQYRKDLAANATKPAP
jgi:hypothetical protein